MYIYIYIYHIVCLQMISPPMTPSILPLAPKTGASDSGLRSTGTALCPVASGAPGPRRAPAPWAGAKVEKST